jgi:hypothetical protein
MRLTITSFIAAMTLAVAGQAFAADRKPCAPGEQEVMEKDRTTTCIKVYGARPETNSRLAYQVPPSESAGAK